MDRLAKIHFKYCPQCLKAHRTAGFQPNHAFIGAYALMCEIGQRFADSIIKNMRYNLFG